jgi:hypothetical protein
MQLFLTTKYTRCRPCAPDLPEYVRPPRAVAKFASGHWSSVPTEIGLAENSDFANVTGLVRQAHEYQMSDE